MSAVPYSAGVARRNYFRRAHWPVLLSLIPAAALAVFAWMSLQDDRRWAEDEARERAQSALQLTSVGLTNALARDVEIFRRAAVTESTGTEWRATNAPPAVAAFQQRFPDLGRAHLTPPSLLLSTEGTVLQPPAVDSTPVSPRWFRELTSTGTLAWTRLLDAVDKRDTNEIATAASLLRDPSTTAEVLTIIDLTQTAITQRGSAASLPEVLESMDYPVDIMPGGLSFSAYLYAVDSRWHRSQSFTYHELTVLSNLVTRVPSALTPFFLEEARGRAEKTMLRTGVEQLQVIWEADERRRAVASGWWRSKPTVNQAPQWLSVGTSRWLVGARAIEPTAGRPAISVEILPDWLVARILRDELNTRNDSLPVGLSYEVSLAGVRLIGGTNIPGSAINLATVEARAVTDPAYSPMQLEVAALLTDPEALYARTRQRQRLFASLVGLSLLIALLGAWLSARAIRRQELLVEQRGNFVAAVSHELRAPIASVRLLAENLERGTVQTEPKRHEYYGLIARETRRLSQLIANVLDFGRLDRRPATYLPGPSNLRTIVDESVAMMQPQAAEREVALTLDLPEAGVATSLIADAPALQRLLVNLLDNALKHSPTGGVVRVTLSSHFGPPAEFAIAVADQGPGIPEADRSRIFEPFVRLGSELRRETPGVGLGLALAKHIAHGHGGSVDLESTRSASVQPFDCAYHAKFLTEHVAPIDY